MLVETYEVTETLADGSLEFEQEQVQLIEKLELEGQLKLVSTGEAEEKNLFPYRKMSQEEKIVYETICPEKTPLESYTSSAIPLRVLQVAMHVKSFQRGKLNVWSTTNSDVKDPVLTLEIKEGYTYQYWLLARWGEVLESFEKLKAKAFQILRNSRLELYKDMKDKLDLLSKQVLNSGSILSLNALPTSLSQWDVRR